LGKVAALKITDIMNLLNEVEERFPVDLWMINGIHIWPLIRLELATDLTNYSMYPALYHSARSVSKERRWATLLMQEASGLLRFGRAYMKDFSKNANPRKAEVVFLSDGISFSYLLDSWYDKWCDPFVKKLSEDNISSFLMTPSHHYFIPRRTSSMFIQPYLDGIRAKTLFSSKKGFGEEKLDGFQEFMNFIESRDLRISLPNFRRIKDEYILIKKYAEFFEQVFCQIKPQYAFLVSYYNITGMAFTLACRHLGINSVDIQHGLQGDLHWAYGRWTKVPERGYELLPKFFWVWSDSEAEAIQRWSSRLSPWHQPIAGGNLFLGLWRSSNDEIVKYYDEEIGNVKREKRGLIHVLYTIGYEEMDKLATIFNTMKQSESICYWWLRVHPGKLRDKEAFKKLVQQHRILNGEVDLATDLPLYALLRQMDLHLTFYSSSVFEAEDLGVPSVVVGDYGKELFSEQISSGWAFPADTAEEIISGIKVQFQKRKSLEKTKMERDEVKAREKKGVIGLMKEARITS
jgi:hypothetical protein